MISKQSKLKNIAARIEKTRPKAIVLLGNRPLWLYKTYQQSVAKQPFPPSLALSALYVDRFLAGVANATGICYEIPAVTGLVQLRSLTEQPLRRIGVLYRAWMKTIYRHNRELAAAEEFELVGVQLQDKVTFQQLNYHLRRLLRSDIDALWVLNDNVLLSERFLQNAWLPALKRFDKPVVVGFERLTRPAIAFGTYAVSPDDYDLGLQGAEMLLDIKTAGWRAEGLAIADPLSTRKLLNLALSREKSIPINLGQLNELDKIID